MPDDLHILGIRHHGPGSAKTVVRALDELQPDCVLIEGPPDAQELLESASDTGLVPPVAMLVYAPEDPERGSFYPMAVYSPEWQAMRWAAERKVETRFIDLPHSHRLALEAEPKEKPDDPDFASMSGDEVLEWIKGELFDVREDPLGHLAKAAGYSDGERWWDDMIESRRENPIGIFEGVSEAMAAVREATEVMHEAVPSGRQEDDLLREAFMRKLIRQARKDGFSNIAIVCGAWHAPALATIDERGVSTDDNKKLRGMKKVKTAAAWAPWTYDRLASESGYGAGVTSPEWYGLLWENPPHLATTWLTRVARLMREADLDTSSAHVIESVRLAEALAAMRGGSEPGRDELEEPALSIICGGQTAPLKLIRQKLVIGERMGEVPEGAATPPLQRDLAAQQKALRMKPSATSSEMELDLRKDMHLARSHLLHRLTLLGITWGHQVEDFRRSAGTFRETWQMQWNPTLSLILVGATRWGNTVESAATAKVIDEAGAADSLAKLTALLARTTLAELPGATRSLVKALTDQAAIAGDVPQLLGAIPDLARTLRYGNVRGGDAESIGHVLDGLVSRACIGLPGACASLDEDAAGVMRLHIEAVEAALRMLEAEAHLTEWHAALAAISTSDTVHGLVAGKATRLLHDAIVFEPEETANRISLALSQSVEAADVAAWVEGFLSGAGAILVHDARLLEPIDAWVCSLTDAHFTEVVPLLRRTFSTFEAGERRALAGQIASGKSAGPKVQMVAAADFDPERAAKVLPLISLILGGDDDGQ